MGLVTAMDDFGPWYRLKEAAEMMGGIHPVSLRAMCAAREVACMKIGGAYRISQQTIAGWNRQHIVPPATYPAAVKARYGR